MIGLVRVGNQAMPDHFAYLPFIGLFLMSTWLAADCATDWAPDWPKDGPAHQAKNWAAGDSTSDPEKVRRARARRISAAWLSIPAIAVLFILGGLTYRQLGYWRDSASIWTRTLAVTENNTVAHDMLGFYLSDEGHSAEALAHFHAAMAILPIDLDANLALGAYEQAGGNPRAAIVHYQVITRHAAQPILRAEAYANLGWVYRQLGDLSMAKQSFETSSNLAPDQPMPLIGLGLLAQKMGNFAEAIRQYSRAMSLQPTDVGYLLIASALEQQGKSGDAAAFRKRAASVSHDLAAAQKEVQSLLGR